jgi:DNA-binding transcriptional LysR family regulator
MKFSRACHTHLFVRLIQRSTRSFNLTGEGAAYFERVAPLQQAMEEAEL